MGGVCIVRDNTQTDTIEMTATKCMKPTNLSMDVLQKRTFDMTRKEARVSRGIVHIGAPNHKRSFDDVALLSYLTH